MNQCMIILFAAAMANLLALACFMSLCFALAIMAIQLQEGTVSVLVSTAQITKRMKSLFLVGFLLLQSCSGGFAPSNLRAKPLRTPLQSGLQLSLNDDWTELASRVTRASSISKPPLASSAAVNSVPVAPQSFQFPDLGLPSLPSIDGLGLQGVSEVTHQFATEIESLTSEATTLFLALPFLAKIGVSLLPVAIVLFGAFSGIALVVPDDFRKGFEPYARGNYDPIQAKAYYSRHNILVYQRASQVFRLSNSFFFNILFDKYILKDEERNRAARADELLDLVTKLGPTAIKIGQALSVRPDLIPQEYATALSTLQDSVPPFNGDAAKEILGRELGPEKYSHLKNFPFMRQNSGPVASASIGQVYRGFIDDQEVAVKVQRPNVLAEIALDLHLVKEFAPLYKKLTGAASDLEGLANEWGRGFIAELDYRTEAENTIRFSEEMTKRNLKAVSAPKVIKNYSTEQVLVTEWVDGVRLDKSDAADVPRLCAVALNAYLVMLLELRSLHCDPHPGNLLRTKDGQLVILDFGMTLDIDPSLQYSLLDYVAHLTSNDYDKLPEDLVALGFLKEDKLDFAKRSGALEPLKYFLRQAGEGGGARGVRERIFAEYREKYPGLSDDELRIEMRSEMKAQVKEIAEREGAVTGLTVEVEELQRRNRDSFRIPEWFLYTSRAFLTLEGVSLQADENFSIIKSCFPYVAKRLLGDDSPRAQKALRELLYGAENQIDSQRILDLADGFSSYTTTSKQVERAAVLAKNAEPGLARPLTTAERKEKMAQTEATLTLAKDAADILLNKNGNLVQQLLIEESVRATSARVKDNIKDILVDGPSRFRESLPFGAGSFLPPLPFETQLRPFIGKTDDEVKAQQLTEKLLSLVSQQQLDRIRNGAEYIPAKSGDVAGASAPGVNALLQDLEPEQLALLSRELRTSAPKYFPLAGVLGAKFASALLQTASNNIDTALAEAELNGQQADGITKATARGLSSFATGSANLISDRVLASLSNHEGDDSML